MTFRAGDIVTLKSGGQPLTVASVDADDATCLWLGEEGDLFRERIPLVALAAIDFEEDDDGDEETGDEDTEESSEDESSEAGAAV